MREQTRRSFLKKAAVASAAASSAGSLSTVEAAQSDKKTPVILYHETDAWKRFYETLK